MTEHTSKNGKLTWNAKDFVYVVGFTLGLMLQFLANYRATELKVQHLQDTKADKTELMQVESELKATLQKIETMVSRIDERTLKGG